MSSIIIITSSNYQIQQEILVPSIKEASQLSILVYKYLLSLIKSVCSIFPPKMPKSYLKKKGENPAHKESRSSLSGAYGRSTSKRSVSGPVSIVLQTCNTGRSKCLLVIKWSRKQSRLQCSGWGIEGFKHPPPLLDIDPVNGLPPRSYKQIQKNSFRTLNITTSQYLLNQQ